MFTMTPNRVYQSVHFVTYYPSQIKYTHHTKTLQNLFQTVKIRDNPQVDKGIRTPL